jgi:hypothetical protein
MEQESNEYEMWFDSIEKGVLDELRILRKDYKNQQENLQRLMQLEASLKIWYESITNFCRMNRNGCFFKSNKTYIRPDHFETFITTMFADVPAFYMPIHQNFIDFKRKMDMGRMEGMEEQPGSEARRPEARRPEARAAPSSEDTFLTVEDEMTEGGKRRKLKRKRNNSKSKRIRRSRRSRRSRRTN